MLGNDMLDMADILGKAAMFVWELQGGEAFDGIATAEVLGGTAEMQDKDMDFCNKR